MSTFSFYEKTSRLIFICVNATIEAPDAEQSKLHIAARKHLLPHLLDRKNVLTPPFNFNRIRYIAKSNSMKTQSETNARIFAWQDGAPRAGLTRRSLRSRSKYRQRLSDGEIVALDEDGSQCFEQLQNHKRDCFIIYFAFDLLFLNGKSLTEVPLNAKPNSNEYYPKAWLEESGLLIMLPTEGWICLQHSKHSSLREW